MPQDLKAVAQYGSSATYCAFVSGISQSHVIIGIGLTLTAIHYALAALLLFHFRWGKAA